MNHNHASSYAVVPLVLAMACGALAVLWPDWRNELKAQGGYGDHLKCYKYRDSLKLKGPEEPWLDLTGPQFGSEDCKIVGRFRLFCVPVTKTITGVIQRRSAPPGGKFEDFDPNPLPGAEQITQDKICYKIKCEGKYPEPPNPGLEITDQFGGRIATKLEPFLLCGPAVKGGFPTSTTTTTLPPACGDGVPQAGEECDDGNLVDGDGCDAECHVAECLSCTGVPSTCTPITACANGDGCCPDGCTSTNDNDCPPVSDCPGDPSRTIFAAGGCQQYDGNADLCYQAWAISTSGEAISCFFDPDELCQGGTPPREIAGFCTNACRLDSITTTTTTTTTTACYDADGDGICPPADCDDADPAVNPAMAQRCDDGIDNDCDGAVDGPDTDCGGPGGSTESLQT